MLQKGVRVRAHARSHSFFLTKHFELANVNGYACQMFNAVQSRFRNETKCSHDVRCTHASNDSSSESSPNNPTDSNIRNTKQK